jgi:uncharacterized protein YbjT (DUF2867 family)
MTLVVGATGALGFEICSRLRASGISVRALARPGSSRESDLAALGAEIVYGDLKDPASLAAACSGVHHVISTASAMKSRGKGDNLDSVDLYGHLSLVNAARTAGVRHFVYISVSAEANPRAVLVRYKRRVERAVRESGMEWTVLQPARFMETWFSPAAGWDIGKGRVRIVGSGTEQSNSVSLHDVAVFTALTASRPDTERRVIPIGGPDVVSANDAVRIFEETLERKLEVRHVPAGVVEIAGTILRPINPVVSSMLALAAGNSRGEVINMSLVLAEFPVELTSLREFVRRLAS